MEAVTAEAVSGINDENLCHDAEPQAGHEGAPVTEVPFTGGKIPPDSSSPGRSAPQDESGSSIASASPPKSSDAGVDEETTGCATIRRRSTVAALLRRRKKQQTSLSVYLMNRRLNRKARTFSSSLTQPLGLRLLSRFHKLDAGFFRRYMTYFAGDFKTRPGDSPLSLDEMRLATSAHFAALRVEPLDLLAAFMRTTSSSSTSEGQLAEADALEALCSPPAPLPPPTHRTQPSRQSLTTQTGN